jgi:hypothetical protein
MRTFSLLLAVFFVIQGPLCALHGPSSAEAREASAPSASHDCCPEPQASPGAPTDTADDGARSPDAACAAHCASLSQLVSSATFSLGKILPVGLHGPVAVETLSAPTVAFAGPGSGHVSLLQHGLASRNTPLLI